VDNVHHAGILIYYFSIFLYPLDREGTSWIVDMMERFKSGNADYSEIDML